MKVRFEMSVQFGNPIQLINSTERKKEHSVRGIYVITHGKPKRKDFDALAAKIIYMGKAIGETIFSRGTKFMQAIEGHPDRRPGKSFQAYRETINRDPSNLWITAGIMDDKFPYLISCMEEYLLHLFNQKHKKNPKCNSAGQARSA